jgi:hypothetical protein
VKTTRIIHERIAQSKFKLIDNAGQLSNIDQPRDFDNAVLASLKGADS